MARPSLRRLFKPEVITLLVVVVAFVGSLWLSFSMMAFNREPTDPNRFSRAVEKELDQTLQRVVHEGNVPGAIVGIWIPGSGTWVEATGTSDVETHAPMDPADKVRIGSMTKTFVATVALQLVDEGKLGLNDTLDTFIPSYPNARSIDVRHLLNHTSGLYDFVTDRGFAEQAMTNRLRKWKPEELLEYAAANSPYFEPGAGWHYSNTNYVLMGMIIERVTGRPLAGEVTARIIGPLGLEDTSYPDGPAIEPPYSLGYDEYNGTLYDVSSVDPSAGQGSAAMVSSVRDLKTWVEALARGRLVKPGSQAERLKWVNPDDATGERSYGLGIVDYAGFLGHDGNAYGYSVAAYYHPSSHATIVVILNKAPGVDMTANRAFAEFTRVVLPGKGPSVE